MTIFYIAAAGNDSNPGTQALPWQTVAKVNAHTPSPGDSYLFNGGDSFAGPLIPAAGGTSGNPITYSSYGTGQATITVPSGHDGVYIGELSYITVANLIFTGGSADPSVNSGIGVFLETFSANNNQYTGITISGCTFSLFGLGGTIGNDATSPSNPGFVNPLISQCIFHNNGDGFSSYSNNTGVHSHTNVQIVNCVSFSNGVVGTVSGNSGSGFVLGGCAGGTITGCVAHTNGAASTGGPLGIWAYESANIVISFCESYNNTSNGTDGGGYDLDGGCTNCVIEYCYSHGNKSYGYLLYDYSGVTTSGNTIRFCVSENDCVGGTAVGSINIGTGSASVFTGALVYGNTVYQSRASCPCVILDAGAATGCAFYNNIFYAANNYRFIDTSGLTPSALTFAGNDYFGTAAFNWAGTSYSTFAAWQTATGQEKISGGNVGLTSNPGLTSPGNGGTVNTGSYVTPALLAGLTAYTLGPTSAMFHAGLNLTTDFSISPGAQDFYSNPITAASLSVGAASPINLGAVTESVVLADYILQNGLNAFSTATNIEVCFAQPTTYLQAVTTFNLGTAADASLFAAPVTAGGNGQKVTSLAITNGSITAPSGGTASWFAVTDHVNSRLLAAIPLASPAVVGAGQAFSFQTTITIPAIAPVVSALTAASLAPSSPAFSSSPLNNKVGLQAALLAPASPVFSTPSSGSGGGTLPAGVTLRAIDGETMTSSTTMSNNYYTRNGYTGAATMGWDSPSFFSMGPWESDYNDSIVPGAIEAMTALKWNTLLSWGNPPTSASITANAVSVIASIENSQTSSVNLVGLNTWDEPPSYADGVSTALSTTANAVQDTMFWWVNCTINLLDGFGDGIQSGAPSPATATSVFAQLITTPSGRQRHIDLISIDIYWFTGSRDPNWSVFMVELGKGFYGLGSNITVDQSARGSNYGDVIDQLRLLQAGGTPAPLGIYLETGDPFWVAGGSTPSSSADVILPPEFNRAAWAMIIHGARIIYMFDHFGPTTGTGTTDDNLMDSRNTFYRTVQPGQNITMYNQVAATCGQINSLAPVINSPFALGYASVTPAGYTFPTATKSLAGGVEVMTKWYQGGVYTPSSGPLAEVGITNGFYIFSDLRYGETSGTFPVTATYTVNDSNATSVTELFSGIIIPIVGGTFSYTFPKAWSVAVFRVSNGSAPVAPTVYMNFPVSAWAAGFQTATDPISVNGQWQIHGIYSASYGSTPTELNPADVALSNTDPTGAGDGGEGFMTLTLTTSASPWMGAEIQNPPFNQTGQFGHGYYEFRAKVPTKISGGSGVVGLFYKAYDGATNTYGSQEIDIEFLMNVTTPTVEFTAQTGPATETYTLPFDPTLAFHRYGFLWLANGNISWTVDGVIVYTLTAVAGYTANTPGAIMMNFWNGNAAYGGASAPPSNENACVNWVKYWAGATTVMSD